MPSYEMWSLLSSAAEHAAYVTEDKDLADRWWAVAVHADEQAWELYRKEGRP